MATAQLYLDTRRAKDDKTYPVKIRVGNGKLARLYSTKFSFDSKEFDKIIEGKYLTEDQKEVKVKIDTLIKKAEGIIQDLQPFSYEAFTLRFTEKGNKTDLLYLLTSKAERLRKEDKLSNANLYEQAANLLARYNSKQTKSKELPITSVNPKWLQGFQDWALKQKPERKKVKGGIVKKTGTAAEVNTYSKTTLGMYLIRVRAIFNEAISDKMLHASHYPFHRPDNKKGYSIPKGANNKRPLTKSEIMKIYNFKTDNAGEQFAKDVFIFSYLSNGMNAVDIFRLKWTDIDGDSFGFVRKKTENKPGGANQIIVALNEDLRAIIARHGTRKLDSPYIFNVIPGGASEKLALQKVRSNIAMINLSLKKIARVLDITSDISTYFARHSFATNLMNNEAPLALISQALGHSKISTTESYLSAFSSEKAKQYMENLLDKKVS